MAKILVVDDEEPIRNVISQILEAKGHTCTLAAHAIEAREFLKEQNCELILCDINMPGESGLDLIRYVSTEYKDTVVIMVTALDDPLIAENVFEIGVYDYIAKPIRRNRILTSVANALRRRELEIANRTYRENLEQMVAERTAKLREALGGIIHAAAMMVETRDPYTAGHQRRVTDLARTVAKEMGLSQDLIDGIRMAGAVHDLGKLSVPADILSKPGRISEPEFEIIKTHPQVGYDILKEIEFPWPVAEIILQHHERMDGSGYPKGLSGEDILQEARILAVADVVEAMSSHRPYRPALGIDKALEEISQNRSILYDPEVVDITLKIFTEKGFEFSQAD
ncbi:MAG: response regulator [Thermodesulfobacteriota bacterium]|nr:response regulator [Thermodesulfobacteriota bacterium]